MWRDINFEFYIFLFLGYSRPIISTLHKNMRFCAYFKAAPGKLLFAV